MKHERIRYPDGQISVKIEEPQGFAVIKERINSYEDLFAIKSIKQVLNRPSNLFIPCLFGQRSDRKFSDNQSFDLKIIADFINSCNFHQVEILDPHSDVSLALINNSVKISSFEYVQKVMAELYKPEMGINTCNLVLVSPDAGAYKKVFEYGEKLGLEVCAAVKHRSLTGEIDLKFIGDVKGKKCLIVDDICDGGYTFLQLGEKLKEQGASKVYLYVTHGYFSKGFDELRKVIDHIYCTNSVKDISNFVHNTAKVVRQDDYVTQFKVI